MDREQKDFKVPGHVPHWMPYRHLGPGDWRYRVVVRLATAGMAVMMGSGMALWILLIAMVPLSH